MTAPTTASPAHGRVRLGELLVKAGVITDVQLRASLQEQKQWGGKLGDILVRLKYVSEDIFVRALSKQLGLPRADLSLNVAPEVLAKVPAELADEYEIIPIGLIEDGKSLAIATSDPLNFTVLDFVRSLVGVRIVPYVGGASAIRAAIARLYKLEGRDADGQIRIVSNSDDTAVSNTTPQHHGGIAFSSASRAAGVDTGRTAREPGSAGVAGTPALQANQTYYPPAPAANRPTPVYGSVSPYRGASAVAVQLPAMAALPGGADEAHRREVVALKALVELLVQKGVISLDEYLTRLKR